MLMSAQTELKKGGARERISFTPVWDWGGAGPDDGSGGQDRRMDLAVFAAVQDLAENRSARPFPLKIWDEPGDALDARGQELFCQWVAEQARVRGTGLLITHSQQIADSVTPDHVWTVVMDPDGSSRVEIE
jgi:ABC-type multidrug transport system ATPase subunit